MGWVMATGSCLACQKVFMFNPHKVPSSSAVTGKREPLCADCIDRINVKRKELGMEPFEISPDAYEPLPEEEL